MNVYLPILGYFNFKLFQLLVELGSSNLYKLLLVLGIVLAHLGIEHCLEGIKMRLEC
jgi:hypothetical protein